MFNSLRPVTHEIEYTFVTRSGEPIKQTETINEEDTTRAWKVAKEHVSEVWGVIKSFRRIEEFDITKL